MTKQYANRVLYTDVEPYEVVEVRTVGKMLIRRMAATLDPEWKMDFEPGGFVGHVHNNRSQRYFYASLPDAPLVAIRKHKNGRWYDSKGGRYSLADQPYKFYDYNF